MESFDLKESDAQLLKKLRKFSAGFLRPTKANRPYLYLKFHLSMYNILPILYCSSVNV